MIPKGVVQNDSSKMAGSKLNILHRIGTYQTLLGSFQHIKKQVIAINTPQITYLILSLIDICILLIMPNIMAINIAANMDNIQLGTGMKRDFFAVVFIAFSKLPIKTTQAESIFIVNSLNWHCTQPV
jgi:hypothetical protein